MKQGKVLPFPIRGKRAQPREALTEKEQWAYSRLTELSRQMTPQELEAKFQAGDDPEFEDAYVYGLIAIRKLAGLSVAEMLGPELAETFGFGGQA